MYRRLSSTDLYDIRLTFVLDDGIKHRFNFLQASVASIMWRRHGIAGRTGQVTTIRHFYYRKAAMLFMIYTEPTVIGAAVFHIRTEMIGHFRSFVIVSDVFVILYIRGYFCFEKTVIRTSLGHKNSFILYNDLCSHSFQTFRAKAYRIVVIGIVSYRHNVILNPYPQIYPLIRPQTSRQITKVCMNCFLLNFLSPFLS